MLNNNFINKIKLHFHKDKELYLLLYGILGFYPKHIELYKLALSHKSVKLKTDNGKPLNNERLEFLGDAILDAVVGDIVYTHFPKKGEGFLTNTRSKIVHRGSLNKLADSLGLTDLVNSSSKVVSHNSYMGGNAFEALVGAIYLDKGYNYCKQFIEQRILTTYIDIDTLANKEINFKSKLLEWLQKHKMTFDFQLISFTKDENGSPIFRYSVIIEGIVCAKGKGFSKKESQQKASEYALNKIHNDSTLLDNIFEEKKKRIVKEEQEKINKIDNEEQKTENNIPKNNENEKLKVENNKETNNHFSIENKDTKKNIINQIEIDNKQNVSKKSHANLSNAH